MVKPSRGMQPEGVDLKKAGRAAGRAFQDDSFRNYMARKIDLQRKQFGVQVPPPPPPPAQQQQQQQQSKHVTSVSFDPNIDQQVEEVRSRKRRKKMSMMEILQRLKRRHGSSKSLASPGAETNKVTSNIRINSSSVNHLTQIPVPEACIDEDFDHAVEEDCEKQLATEPKSVLFSQSNIPLETSKSKQRSDLFFAGVIVIINGYTHPDAESLQRLLQKHGGDVERYETTRVTHVIAEHLSTAKAKIYAKQRKPLPVVFPSWIMDCIKEQRLLPHGPYLIPEVRDLNQQPSVTSFFQKPPPSTTEKETPPLLLEYEAMSSVVKNIDGPIETGVRGIRDGREDAESFTTDKSFSSKAQITSPGTREVHNPYATGCKKSLPGGAMSLTSKVATTLKGSANGESTDSHDRACMANDELPSVGKKSPPKGRTDEKYINGKVRTVGTDPNFLETFFAESRLSFIGSFRQRVCGTSSSFAPSTRSSDRPPNRFVLHVDMDSFFASVVLRNHPEHRDKPVAICHFGKSGPDGAELAGKESTSECATINYKAREFGIKKGMYLGQARILCPKLIVLPYDFQGYEEVSEQVSQICHRYAADHFGTVETVSCDESYIEIYANSIDIVGQLANDIRRDIFETTKCTATIGVAANKFLAKLATDKVKPNGWYVASDYVELLQNLKLRDLHGIGYRSEPKLLENGLETVQDVWNRGHEAENDLQSILGKQMGTKIYHFCKGIDDRPVQAAERKTIGAECNYGVRFDGPYGVDYLIVGLCKEVQKRMEHVGVKGAKITLKVKQRKEGAPPPPKFLGHGSCYNLSKSLDFSRPTRDSAEMSHLCKKMFIEMKVPIDDVRGMGVIMSKLLVDRKVSTEGIRSFFRIRRESEDDNTVNKKQLDCVDLNKCGDHSGGLEVDLSDCDATASRTINLLESDNEEWGCSDAVSQNSSDDEHREVLMLTQLSASSSEGLEDSGCKRNRRSFDSFSDIGFMRTPSRRLSIDSSAVHATAEWEKKHNRSSIDSIDLAVEDSGRKAFRDTVEPLDLAIKDSRTKMARREVDTYDDFEIPGLSQLAMSQVGFLPTPMRRKVHAKIQEERDATERAAATENKTKVASVTTKEAAVPRFRQTDVGRMMRLAAVKARQGDAEQQATISSTQLERLPLEVQLQVVNNDTLSLGKHSHTKKAPRKFVSNGNVRTKADLKRRYTSIKTKLPPPSSATLKTQTQKIAANQDPESIIVYMPPLDEGEFFSENILPLSTFLDENNAVGESLAIVQDFVRHFMDEYSWHEVVLLLRSIRNRRDDWSKEECFHRIYEEVNAKFKLETGDDFDFD